MTMLRFAIGTSRPSDDLIAKLAGMIRAGEVVILPTDTLYGLHCDARNEIAIERIRAIKERDRDKPLLVLASGLDQLEPLGVQLSREARETLDAIWPAPLTAVLPLARAVPASAGGRTLAVRVPALEWLRRLIEISGPVISTSVNVAGESPLYSMDPLADRLMKQTAAAVDAGRLEGRPSTLVDFTADPPRVLRKGAYGFSQDLWKTSRKSL